MRTERIARRFPPLAGLVLTVLSTVAAAEAPGNLGYYRFPALHGDTLVFESEDDLWRVGVEGGLAMRLTSHLGEESRPAISPDGRTLAFSATYDGPTEVYAMPLDGGLPRRLTFSGEPVAVAGWTPDGRILFATRGESTLPDTRLGTLDPETAERAMLPLAQAAEGSYTPDGGTLVFTRLRFQGSHTKGYKGGTAQNLWRLDAGADEARPLTADYPGTSRSPLVWQRRVLFVSDRDGSMNLWSMDLDGGDLRQHTHHQGWDVDQPSLSGGRVAYKLGAEIRLLDLASGEDRAIPIRLASDFDQRRETWVEKPMDYLSSIALSPEGDRVALTARGQVFVAPVGQGRLVEATRSAGVRYRRATFDPDGKSLVVLSDASGEVELWRLPANGVGEGRQLTQDGEVLRWEALPSPDGKWIAHTDKNQRLWLYDVAKGTSRKVAESEIDELRHLAWSPDSRTLAFVEPAANDVARVALYHLADGATTYATSDRYDSFGPAFAPDGDWLFFLSNRHLASFVGSPWGSLQPDPFLGAPTEIFAVALRAGARSPFAPEDELHPASAEKEKGEEKKEPGSAAGKEAKKPAPAAAPIEREGLAARLIRVPVPPGRYSELATDGKRLYWLSAEIAQRPERSLAALEIGRDEPEVETLLEKVDEYRLSADRKKLLVRKDDALYVFDAGTKAPEELAESKVDLSGWRFAFSPREEWRQMFVEAWRLERDYFWDRGMSGLDWPAVRAKYEPLVERVASRGELSDLLAQMISELGALHMFVYGGDRREGREDVDVASLGALWTRDEAAGGFRIRRLFRGDPDQPDELAPLARPEVAAREGEVLTAIDGVPALSVSEPGALLRGKAGRQVLLRLVGAGGAAREAIATPISPDAESDLRYADWKLSRRERVEELGGGEIGYVHLSAMSGRNYEEWARDYYPVYRRAGLILDVRHNRGGNIDSWILGKLLRRAWFFWQPRLGRPYWSMQYAFRGHLVVLMDQWTASDGEAFAEGARRLGLAKLVGMRTWGGEIWLSSSNTLVDKGIATAAEFGVYGPEGSWLIEGHGVEPDLEVDNLPVATARGGDAQLEAAVRYLQQRIREEPVEVPDAPPYPRR